MKKFILISFLLITILIIFIVFYKDNHITEKQKVRNTSPPPIINLNKDLKEKRPKTKKVIERKNDLFSLAPCDFAKKLNEGKIDFDKIEDTTGALEFYTSFRLIKKLTSTGLQINTAQEEARFIQAYDDIKAIAPRFLLNLYKDKKNIQPIKTQKTDRPYNQMFYELLENSYDASDFKYLDQVIQKIKMNKMKDRDIDDLFESFESLNLFGPLAYISTKRELLSLATTKNEILLILHILKKIEKIDLSPLEELLSQTKKKKHREFLIKLGKKILAANSEVEHPYITVKEHLKVAQNLLKNYKITKDSYLKKIKYQDNFLQHQKSGCDKRFLTDMCDIFCH